LGKRWRLFSLSLEGPGAEITGKQFRRTSQSNRQATARQGLVLSAMGFMGPERIPLFPLNVVLLPGAILPLHIFEPRYRQMVRHCVAEKCEFGVLLASPKGIVRVGCTAEVTEVVKRYNDGRMDIVTVGRSPFRITQLVNADAYANDELLEGDVDFLDDREYRTDACTQNELTRLYEVCHTLIFEDYPRNIESETAEYLSFVVASTLPLDLLCKQQILELRSEADRQQRLVGYLREWAPHLQKEEKARARAGGSGIN
jgi:Lon protease-like protein